MLELNFKSYFVWCVCVFMYYCRICFFFFFENFKISSLYLTFKKTSFIVFMIQSFLMSRNLTQRKCIVLILLLLLITFSELPKSWAFILYIICHTFISVYSYVLDSGIFLRICILISLFGFSFQEMLLILWSLFNECNASFTLWIFLLKYSLTLHKRLFRILVFCFLVLLFIFFSVSYHLGKGLAHDSFAGEP